MQAKVLVTGGSSGLGAAVVTAIAKSGGHPLVLDRRPPEQDVPYLEVDLANGRAAEAATRQLAEEAGGLAAVVTAAGTDRCGPMEEVPPHEWENVIAVNLLGTAAVIRAALPYLLDSHGRIVTIASTLGLRAVGDATAYCASRFGIVGLTRALAAELAGQVGVTLLVPGGMRTAFLDGRAEQYKPGPDAALNRPEDVADAVLFALGQPVGCEVRELVITPEREPSWP